MTDSTKPSELRFAVPGAIFRVLIAAEIGQNEKKVLSFLPVALLILHSFSFQLPSHDQENQDGNGDPLRCGQEPYAPYQIATEEFDQESKGCI